MPCRALQLPNARAGPIGLDSGVTGNVMTPEVVQNKIAAMPGGFGAGFRLARRFAPTQRTVVNEIESLGRTWRLGWRKNTVDPSRVQSANSGNMPLAEYRTVEGS